MILRIEHADGQVSRSGQHLARQEVRDERDGDGDGVAGSHGGVAHPRRGRSGFGTEAEGTYIGGPNEVASDGTEPGYPADREPTPEEARRDAELGALSEDGHALCTLPTRL